MQLYATLALYSLLYSVRIVSVSFSYACALAVFVNCD